jgi:hypothetical protein
MEEQVRKAGKPAPRVIGISEIAVRKRHTYRIVVSDLERGRAICFGGEDRSEKSMDAFFAFLGDKRSKAVEVAVMAMWKPFRKKPHRVGATIVFAHETGLMMAPLVRRTWAAFGKTPILKHATRSHRKVSAMGAIALSAESAACDGCFVS